MTHSSFEFNMADRTKPQRKLREPTAAEIVNLTPWESQKIKNKQLALVNDTGFMVFVERKNLMFLEN